MSELWFDSEWLNLRRRADHQARHTLFNEEANYWLQSRHRKHIVDLGAGTGNNAHYLIPWLGPQQHWRLLDHDPKLLKEALRVLDEVMDPEHQIDTAVVDLNTLDLREVHQKWPIDLVTNAALLDLASVSWMERLVRSCVAIEASALFVLNVNGHWAITGTKHPLDEIIRQAFNAHQQRAKGLGVGPAMGPDAILLTEQAFRESGYSVQTASSMWQLLAGSAYTKGLGFRLISGWHQAACEMLPEQSDELDVWFVSRQTDLANGQVGIEVGHTDLYAEPLAG